MLMRGKGTRGFVRSLIGSSVNNALFILLLLNLLSCRRAPFSPQQSHTSQPVPADLSSCTRIEIRYVPSLLEYGFRGTRRRNVLNSTELAYIRSLDPLVVEQREHIKTLARSIALGTYYDTRHGIPGVADVANVTCYRGAERVASFVFKRGPFIRFEDDKWFSYDNTRLELFEIATDVKPLVLRADCADNLGMLMEYWSPRVGAAPRRPTQDEQDTWCDTTISMSFQGLMDSETQDYVAHVMGRFRCPAAGEGRCHYAMNPECKVNSAADTVFLFETTAGWNQHGGPELFTFDNHDPRGGLVLLNDGTVKFIRTEEELKQLRWK